MAATSKIEKKDFNVVVQWLNKKIENDDYWPVLREGESYTDEMLEKYGQAVESIGAINSIKKLNTWVDKWLDSTQRNKLKTQIRVVNYRKKAAKEGNKSITVNLTNEAHLMLSSIAKAQGLTLSETIEKHLSRQYKNIVTV